LLTAAIYAGTTHRLSIFLVIGIAASGAIIGDNLGCWLGRWGGYYILSRYGPLIHLNEARLKLGFYLFYKHGGKVVFWGRFVTALRMWAAFLAGANHMGWVRFLTFNALGGLVWSTLYGLGGYFLGNHVHQLTGPLGIVLIVLAILIILVAFFVMRRNEHRLEAEAERLFPGPLEKYHTNARAKRDKHDVVYDVSQEDTVHTRAVTSDSDIYTYPTSPLPLFNQYQRDKRF
jgi:membrane protein DedA with SNARE-associated domain